MEATASVNESKNRFASTTSEQLQQYLSNATPMNTTNKAKWAMNVFKSWLAGWRVRIDDDILKVLKDLEEFTIEDLDYCLRYFWCDVRKENGE